jgi:hypothetical protein
MSRRKTPLPPALARKAGSERRTMVRHACDYDAPFRIGDSFGTARIRDVSAGGIGMLVPHPVSPGGLLTVELPDRTGHTFRLKMLHVVHATRHNAQQWLIGSAFTRRLTHVELYAVLR